MEISRQTKRRMGWATATSAFVTILAAFEWSIIGRITPIIYFPLAGLAWSAFFVVAVYNFFSLFRNWRDEWSAIAPIATQFLTIAAVFFVPFTEIWLKANFARYKEQRNIIVNDIYSGKLLPNTARTNPMIELGNGYAWVSEGGNRALT